MAYSENFLPKEAAYYTLDNATITNGRLSIQAGGSAQLVIDQTRLSAITSTLLFNVYADRLLDPLHTSLIMYLDITLEDGTIEHIAVYPNQLNDSALSFPIELKDGAYTTCLLTIKAYVPCDLLVYEICAEQVSDVTTIIDGVKQSLPHVLYDYNESDFTINQTESIVAMIACSLQGNTDVNGHFLMDFYSEEQCDVYLRFYDNEVEELYTPLKYTVNPGHSSIGVPHAYLKRLAGLHTFVVTCQCTNGNLSMYTRGILFTIDAGYLAERLIDAGMNIQDISCKHITLSQEPEELWAIGIDANEVLVKKRSFGTEASSAWTPLYSFNYYPHVAMEFNGVWEKVPKQLAYTIITAEEPHIFAIDDLQDLYVWIGNDEPNKILLDTNVQDVHALRGYSSIIYPEQDQGLICLYLKEGKLYYRAFTYYNGAYAWSVAKIICEEDAAIIEFSIHRLNDYRIGIIYSTATDNYWVISDRTYVNQAVPAEEEFIYGYFSKKLTSMTNPTQKFTGIPCTFEIPTEAQQEFTITYELPLAHLIEEYEKAKRLKEIFKITLNNVVPEEYDIFFVENVLHILLKEPAAATRKEECNIKLVVDNSSIDIYLKTSNNGHGVPIKSETFSWVIEREIITTNVSTSETSTIGITINSYNLKMNPIIKNNKRSIEECNVHPALTQHAIQMNEIIYSTKKIYEEAIIDVTLNDVNIVCTQTGVKPI